MNQIVKVLNFLYRKLSRSRRARNQTRNNSASSRGSSDDLDTDYTNRTNSKGRFGIATKRMETNCEHIETVKDVVTCCSVFKVFAPFTKRARIRKPWKNYRHLRRSRRQCSFNGYDYNHSGPFESFRQPSRNTSRALSPSLYDSTSHLGAENINVNRR